jgi:predicted molibdopterin-dependent oxidoreductase YjgC
MIKLRIDNKEVFAEDGRTILEVARDTGLHIPTLCNKDGAPHYTSCMVCLVRDERTGNFLPSCTALAQNEMEIYVSGEEVIDLRKKAVELLLSEHRAECEAPCRTVCPVGYNIPLMNRLLAGGKTDLAGELYSKQLNTPYLWCWNCPGYCENACRRKKIDNQVSIRNLQIFNSGEMEPTGKEPMEKPEKSKKRFSSFTGPLEPDELKEWLKECVGDLKRHREISGIEVASEEAQSCMHCDCRAADDCRLRDVAEALNIKDPRGKIVNAPAKRKINPQTNLIFENAKCIKCGLCVTICEDKTEEPALCFINRGFISIISEPLTESFESILRNKAKDCIEICPTGALSYFKINPADETKI